jgi:hypothetical protein
MEISLCLPLNKMEREAGGEGKEKRRKEKVTICVNINYAAILLQ